MAGSSVNKRNKDRARQERQQTKEARRRERRQERNDRPEVAAGVDPDIADIVPGPQPMEET